MTRNASVICGRPAPPTVYGNVAQQLPGSVAQPENGIFQLTRTPPYANPALERTKYR
jgi:hypothetical protein